MTGQAVSEFLGVSPRWLSKLVEQGFAERLSSGLFDVGAVTRGYIAWMKDDSRRSSKTETAKLKEAEQVKKLRIENAAALNQLVDIETVEVTFSEIFTTLRTEFDSVPAGVTRDLDLRADIETLIHGAFDRCRARFDAAQQALCSGSLVLEGDEEGDA